MIDTNIVLDLLVFQDPAAQPLRLALAQGALQWLATAAMRDELERVLAYRHIAPRLTFHCLTAQQVMGAFDAFVCVQPAAVKAPVTCKDPDDQKFIDLAWGQSCVLLSKDKAVRCMARLLAAAGVVVQAVWVGAGVKP
ncbi:MAG: putative toxin-antitoxin system toxin component, PIN family [Burkholderiaceae bacterium]